ncbi:MAG: hypothetical protein AAB110_04545 [Candidatus Desantisbacteria bacterium]
MLSNVSNIVAITIGIITVLGIIIRFAIQLKGIEKEIESTPPIRERLVMLEGKIKEIENLKNAVETIKEQSWIRESQLRSCEIFSNQKNRINK